MHCNLLSDPLKAFYGLSALDFNQITSKSNRFFQIGTLSLHMSVNSRCLSVSFFACT